MPKVAEKRRDPAIHADEPNAAVTSGQFCLTFVPFGLGMVAAIWYPEASQDLRLFRTIYTIRVSMLLAMPGLALFFFRNRSPAMRNVWALFWTFSFLAFFIHMLYGLFGVFGGQVETARLHPENYRVTNDATALDLLMAHQGRPVAWSILIIIGVWLVDVLIAWRGRKAAGGLRRAFDVFHALNWLYVLISFLVAAILFAKNPTILAMGWTMVGTVAFAIVLRLICPTPELARTVS